MIFIKGSQGKVFFDLKSFGDTSDQRQRTMLNMGTHLAYQHNVGELEKLILVNEAWMSKADKNGEFIRPALDPKRIEVVLVNYLDVPTQEETIIMFEMVR